MCPGGVAGAGLASACWPDQKPVRPCGGVTRLVTTPEPLRAELRPLTQARLLARLAATRPQRTDTELRGALLALRSVARRVQQLTGEERELAREIKTLTEKLAPQLLDQPGVGPLLAAQVVLSWSTQRPDQKRGRVRTARRRRPDPSLLRTNDPLPTRPQRRQTTQQSTAPNPRHPQTDPRANDRLHRTPPQRKQNPPRSQPLPQTIPRPQPLPTPRERSAPRRLTNIEASLAQAMETSPARGSAGYWFFAALMTSRITSMTSSGSDSSTAWPVWTMVCLA